ncbi:MAG: acyl-CoA dehydrogenase family protein [Actinomycetota bacterium]
MTASSSIPAVDPLLVESAERLFADTSHFDEVQAAEEAGWSDAVWSAVADAGFAWIGLPADAGGSGGSIADACEVLRIAAAHAAPVPLAETSMLGGWLLTLAGLELPSGAVTVVPGVAGDTLAATTSSGGLRLSGAAARVPWAAASDQIVVLIGDRPETSSGEGLGAPEPMVAVLPPSAVRIEPLGNVAGEPRETVHFDDVSPTTVAAVPAGTRAELRLRAALARASQIAGACAAMSALTVAYTDERQQFGRPISRFQAVQQHLVWGAQDAAITTMAAQMAAHAACGPDGVPGAAFQIAAARTIADDAAASATRWAHQAHGAMGMTQEYALHHLSRRLWAWRREFGAPGEWPGAVGRAAAEVGADGLFPLITS